MRNIISLTLVLAVSITPTLIASAANVADDTTQQKLKVAVEKFDKTYAEEKEDLAEAIAALVKRAEKNRQGKVADRLAIIKDLQEQEQAFLKTGKPPGARPLLKDAIKYYKAVLSAQKDCIEEFEEVADGYAKQGELEKAKSTLSELDKFRSRKVFGDDRFYPGQNFTGIRRHNGLRDKYAIRIVKCDGSKFVANVYIENHDEVYSMIGDAADGKLKSRMKAKTNKIDHSFSGTIEGDEINMSFGGRTAGGGRIGGSITLKLTDENVGED